MREQSLFEETTEMSICKDEKQKQKNPDGVLRLRAKHKTAEVGY